MKNIIVLLLLLFLSGCFYNTTDSVQIEKADQYCKQKNSELYKIKIHTFGLIEVKCRNNINQWNEL